jgi:hypothetical protein
MKGSQFEVLFYCSKQIKNHFLKSSAIEKTDPRGTPLRRIGKMGNKVLIFDGWRGIIFLSFWPFLMTLHRGKEV